MKKFDRLKKEFIELLKGHSPCAPEYRRVLQSETQAELLQVIYDNVSWCITEKVIPQSFLTKFDPKILLESGLANTGKENSGVANSGNWNSGNRNSGDSNSGNWNSGNRNSGDSNSGNWNSGNWNSGNWNSGNRNSGNWNSGDRNSGNWNSGNWNSGDRNSGNWNSGNRNSGDSNSGNWNSGNRNSGDSNSGNWNSGDRNSGNWNSGDRNSGDSNSGNWNSGNWNSGDRNSGDSNSGYRNSGAFCTDTNPKLILFDVQTDIPVREWENHPACRIMNNLNPNIWVWSSEMTVVEKEQYPSYVTTGGFLKSIPYKEAWANLWGNLTDEKKKVFITLPYFNADKFYEITGIKI